MHKNSFVNAPKVLNNYHLNNYPNIFIAGQLSGVEGYIESIASGLNVGLNMFNFLNNDKDIVFDKYSMIGALNNYLSTASPDNFQPMSSNMGLINYGEIKMKDKKAKNQFLSDRALDSVRKTILDNNLKK
jgi:methylenetetrahydrofolate--tRNA-(uracil-5-)-methyltransferase